MSAPTTPTAPTTPKTGTKGEAYAKTPKTPIDIPPEAFPPPTEYEYYLNQAYWNGWMQCANFICNGVILLPSPKGTGDYNHYSTMFAPYYMQDSTFGYVNNGAVGWNNAINQGRNYVWHNDPESPYKVPPS
ncbi:MAG TPA: hypothetical protein VH110_05255 [Candidatus Acidoferrum sp.]|jgi:hypothetical protein|nr:hypothetical protein [Candidatus Acidoferrum sp.]